MIKTRKKLIKLARQKNIRTNTSTHTSHFCNGLFSKTDRSLCRPWDMASHIFMSLFNLFTPFHASLMFLISPLSLS